MNKDKNSDLYHKIGHLVQAAPKTAYDHFKNKSKLYTIIGNRFYMTNLLHANNITGYYVPPSNDQTNLALSLVVILFHKGFVHKNEFNKMYLFNLLFCESII